MTDLIHLLFHSITRPAKSPTSPEASSYNPVRCEEALWRAVITQALMDAASRSRKAEAQYHRDEARHWLLQGGQDFCTVCHYAGLEPDYVRRMAKKALLRGCRWRCEPGRGRRAKSRKPRAAGKSKSSPADVHPALRFFLIPLGKAA